MSRSTAVTGRSEYPFDLLACVTVRSRTGELVSLTYREPRTHAELVRAFGEHPVILPCVPHGWRTLTAFLERHPVLVGSVGAVLLAHHRNIVEVRLARGNLVVVRTVSPKRIARDLERLVAELARGMLEDL